VAMAEAVELVVGVGVATATATGTGVGTSGVADGAQTGSGRTLSQAPDAGADTSLEKEAEAAAL
jgi:hypothetical protein